MSKKTIILIACIVAAILIIAFAVFFITKVQKTDNSNEEKIIITRYDDNFNILKTIEITSKKDIKEIKKICDNISLEQNEDTKYLGIRNDVKVDLGNNKYFMIQLDLEEYCYYEDPSSNISLVIKMPEGLLNKVNSILD